MTPPYVLFLLQLFQRFHHHLGQGNPGKTQILGDGENFVAAESNADGITDVGGAQQLVDLDSHKNEQEHQTLFEQPFDAIDRIIAAGGAFAASVEDQRHDAAGADLMFLDNHQG